MKNKEEIIILGGGQAAVYAAKEIRNHNKYSNLTIISEEDILAYERPPLSKDYLINKKKLEDFMFFTSEFYLENNINYIKNKKIADISFENKTLISSSNDKYVYDKLLIATGSVNKTINLQIDNDKPKTLYLRNNIDSKILKENLIKSNTVLIVGGGFIGLEIASSANQLGKEVHVIEMGSQLMGRSIPKNISNYCKIVHESNGNNIYLNTTIKNIISNQRSCKVTLSNNKVIEVDLIIVGIGSIPNTELFKQKKIEINNGIKTNEFCETSQKNVYAAGDISNFYHPFYKKNIRLESYQHAQNHGICAGKNIIGIKESYNNTPWMWSDQLDINIQLMGLCDEYDHVIQRGANLEEGIIDFFIQNDLVVGACGIGLKGKIGKDIKLAIRILEKKIRVEKDFIENKNFKLSQLLKKV